MATKASTLAAVEDLMSEKSKILKLTAGKPMMGMFALNISHLAGLEWAGQHRCSTSQERWQGSCGTDRIALII